MSKAVAEKQVAPGAVLSSMGAKPFKGLEFISKLRAEKVPDPIDAFQVLLDQGKLKSLGNTGVQDGRKTGFRFVAKPAPEAGKFWVQALPDYALGIKVTGLGTVTQTGQVYELSGAKRSELEARDCPVRVTSDAKLIKQLSVNAEKRSAEKAEAVSRLADRSADMLAELAG